MRSNLNLKNQYREIKNECWFEKARICNRAFTHQNSILISFDSICSLLNSFFRGGSNLISCQGNLIHEGSNLIYGLMKSNRECSYLNYWLSNLNYGDKDKERSTQFLRNKLMLTYEQQTTLTEAALIRYFQPKFNKDYYKRKALIK